MPETKKYNIIYADPPWTYNDKAQAGNRGAGFKYPLMTIDDIKSLPISNLAADNCYLFCWVTFPLLQEGLDTIKAWGFEYKTIGFNWIKTNKKNTSTLFWGMGNHTRACGEICLIGVKGKPQRVSKSVHSVVMSPIQAHSKKPDIIRDRIVQLCGDLPRIELFARNATLGWDVFGNQVEGSVVL